MSENKNNSRFLSANLILQKLREDPSYMAANEKRERARDLHIKEFQTMSAPIVSELNDVGLHFISIDAMRTSGTQYAQGIPILLRWLPAITNQELKESIVRALSVPWARPVAAFPLITEFRATPATASDYKWAIANAIAIVSDDSVFGEIAALVRDAKNGKSREMLAIALGNMRTAAAIDLLIELLRDGNIAGHAIIALGKLNAGRARSEIERFRHHPKQWVRNEAEKALAKLQG